MVQEAKTMKFRLILKICHSEKKNRHFVIHFIKFLWTLHCLSYLFYFKYSKDQRNNCSKIKVQKCLYYKKARSTLSYSILRFTNITL